MPTLKAESVSFDVPRLRILHDVTLSFRRGEVAAIIGPSGCGKSTLLKCLTTVHRATEGTVTLGGKDIWPMRDSFRLQLGYVPQDDIIHRQLTVERAFYYSSRLRLDVGFEAKDIRKRIDSIAGLLGLAERKGTRISRLSGGQRKRVNIGIELLADPDFLILDEPASGLDPGTEEDLVRLLSRLSRMGRTVVMTTHSMEYLDAIDKIVLLVRGRVVFAGALPEMLKHFDVERAADVFQAVRDGDPEGLSRRYLGSPLARREDA